MSDIKERVGKAVGLVEKYKFALIVLVLGLALLSLPLTGDSEETAETAVLTEQQPQEVLEEKLQQALEQVEGAGRVQVVLTVKESQQKVLASDETDSQTKTVTIQNGSGTQTVTVKSIDPVYRGALVVCDGADDPKVKLDIVDSVAALTGLGSDKITVVKMK